MIKLIAKFAADETGAVTVDWVVLAAGIVGVGIAVAGSISNGLDVRASEIDEELTDYAISTSF